jgi:hypothetical protein
MLSGVCVCVCVCVCARSRLQMEWAMITGELVADGYDADGNARVPPGAPAPGTGSVYFSRCACIACVCARRCSRGAEHVPAARRRRRRLQWALSRDAEARIDEACVAARELIDDLDLTVACHEAYGKGFIKTCVLCGSRLRGGG